MVKESKKEIKEYMKKLSDDFGRQIGVYIEHVDDKFKITAEGIMGVNERLDRIQDDMDNLRLEVRDIKLKVHDVSYSVNMTLDKKVDKKLFVDLERRMRVLEKK